MKRRSPSLPKSPFKGRAFLRRATRRALLLSLAFISLSQYANANTADNVVNGQTNLTSAATYSGGLPTTTSDVTFTAQAYSPATFTLGTSRANLSIGTLDDASTTALTIQGPAGGLGIITLNGGTNSDTALGAAAGDLLFVAGGGSLTLQGTTNSAVSLVLATAGNFDIAGSATIGANIFGTVNVAKTGAGTLTLTGANTYSGGLTISAGAVNLNNQFALQSSTVTNSVVNGLTFNSAVTAHTFSIGGLAGASNLTLTDDAANAVALTIGNNNAANTYSGILSGAGSLTKNGSGTETLSGANGYTGTTTINFGTLLVTGSLASSNNVTFTGTGALGVTGKTGGSTQTLGTLSSSAGDNTVTSTFGTVGTTLAVGTYARSAGATTNFVVTNGINGSTNKITLGNVTANTFISPGTFFGGSSYAFYDTGGFVRALDYTNDATAANTSTQTGNPVALTANTTAATQNAQFVGSAGTTSTASAATTASTTLPVANGASFAVGEAVTGTGIAANTYVTAITGNTLTISANATVANGATVTPYNNISAQGTQTVNTLNLSGAGASVALASGATLTTNGILRSGEGATGAISTITGGTSITAGGSTDFVIATPLTTDVLTITTPVNTNGVPLVKSGAGALTLNGTVNNSGGIDVNAGGLVLNGVVSGAGNVTVNGGGVTLNGANTYSGGTFLYGGNVGLGNNAAVLGTGALTIGAPNSGVGVTFAIGNSPNYPNAINVNAGGQRYIFTSGSPTFNLSGLITLNNGANFSVGSGGGGNTFTVSGGFAGAGNFITGSPAGNGRTSNVLLSGGAINMVGFLANNTSASLANGGFGYGSDSAAGSTTQVTAQIGSNVTALYQNSATNTFQLSSAANPFFGDTIVSAGTLNLRNATTLQNSVVNFTGGAATFGTSATVGLTAVTLGGLGGTGNVNLNNTLTTPTAVALTIGNGNAANGSAANPNTLNPTYSGVLSNTNGAASVTKVGSNTQTFTGANTYTGATAVTGGTLALANTTARALTATSSIAVNNGGTLLFGAANQVNVAAPITLGTTAAQMPASTTGILSVAAGANQGTAATVSGGNPAVGTSTAGLGALTLNNTSTLNYAGTATTLVFGLFTANNGSVLNVTGYSNATATADGLNSGAATDDRLVFANGGNTANNALLTSFDFGSGPGVGVFEVNLDNGFYEVGGAVPEPSTWVGGMFVLGALVWQFRRSRRAVN